MVLVWLDHWWFGYSFVMLFVWEWMHCKARYVSRYNCSYCVEKWSSRTKRGFSLYLRHTETWVDIVIIRDDFWTVVDIVIVDSIRTDLVWFALMMIMHATIFGTKNKPWYYIKQVLRNDFISLAIRPIVVSIFILIPILFFVYLSV